MATRRKIIDAEVIGGICKCGKGSVGLVLYKSAKGIYHGVRVMSEYGKPWQARKPKILVPRSEFVETIERVSKLYDKHDSARAKTFEEHLKDALVSKYQRQR